MLYPGLDQIRANQVGELIGRTLLALCCAAWLAVKLADWVFIILVALVTSHGHLGPPNTEKLRDTAGCGLVFKIADG